MKKILYAFLTVCLMLLISAPVIEAQNKKNQKKDFTVYGNVKSEKGIPLMGVEISIQDSFIKTISDENGDFSITVPTVGSVLVLYTEFYQETFITVTSDDFLSITMKDATIGQGARDKVNMPYWTTQKRDLTASIHTVSWETFDKSKVPDLGNALQGRVLGMTSDLQSGSPGYETTNYLIRGNRTLNGVGTANQLVDLFGETTPLIIVDGFEREFDKLDPHEIESFSILKDAAATAIYGNRAMNGVILVNTRHGQTNKRTINFNYYEGLINPIHMPDYVDAATYAEWYNEALVNDGKTAVYSQEDIHLYRSGDSPLTHPNTDFYDAIYKRFTSQRRATISMQGGNKVLRYFVLFGYGFQGALYNVGHNDLYPKGSRYGLTKYNLRSNADVNITKWLQFNMLVGNRILENTSTYNTAATILNAAHDPANAYPLFFNGIDPELKQEIFMLGGDSIHTKNPYGMINYGGFTERTQRWYQTSGHFKADFSTFGLKGLTLEVGGDFDGWNYYDIEKSQAFSVWEYSQDADGKDIYKSYTTPSSLSTSTDYNIRRYYGYDAKLGYSGQWGDHRVNAKAIFTRERKETKGNNDPDYRFENYALWTNYSFKNRYFVDLTGSYAGSDKFFYTNHGHTFFPSVGLGWIISDEPWMKGSNTWLNFLKLRASWGLMGNNEYQFVDVNGNDERYPARVRYWTESGSHCQFGVSLSNFTIINEGRSKNEDIRVEKGSMANLALEASAFKHRLNTQVDVWYQRTFDAYTASAGVYPTVYGAYDARMAITNDGIMNCQGIEVETSWADRIGSFEYAVLGQFSYLDQKMVYIGETFREYDNLYMTGDRSRMDYGYKCLGIFKDWDDVNNSPVQTFGPYGPGDLKYADINGDNIIDSSDQIATGKGVDPRMVYNLSLSLGYKGFGIDILFQGTSAKTTYISSDANRAFYDNGTAQTWMVNRAVLDADGNVANWSPATSPYELYPKFTTQLYDNNFTNSTFWEIDASYLRLKNIEISYSLPEKWLKNMTLEKAKFYISSYNPYTWSYLNKYNIDPEDSYAGTQRYPITRTFNIGLDLTF